MQPDDGMGIFDADAVFAVSIAMSIIFFSEAIQNGKQYDFIMFIALLCASILTKRIAILLAAVLLIGILPYLIITDRKKWGIITSITIVLSYLLMYRLDVYLLFPVLSVFVAYMIALLIKRNCHSIFVNHPCHIYAGVLVAFVILAVLIKKIIVVDGFKKDVQQTYVGALFQTDNYMIGAAFHISIAVFVLGLLGFYTIVFLHEKTNINTKFSFAMIFSLNCIYLCMFYFLFPIIAKSQFESTGMYLAGFGRYMGFVPVTIAIFMLYFGCCHFDKLKYFIVAFVTIVSFSRIPSAYGYFMNTPNRYSYEAFNKGVKELRETDKIAYIHMDKDNTFLYDFFAFGLEYIENDIAFVDFSELINDYDIENAESIKKQLAQSDYIWVSEVNEEFVSEHGVDLFGSSEIIPRKVYKYDVSSGQLFNLNE